MEGLRSALEGTFDYLKRLAAGAEDDHSPSTELPYNEGSLVFLRTSFQHSPVSSEVDNAVSCLQSMQLDTKKYRDKVDDAFLRIVEINNQPTSISTSTLAMMTIRDNFIRFLKPRKSRRGGLGSDNRPPDAPTSGLLLQLPPELLILIITLLNDDCLEDLPRRTNPLPALRL